MSVSLPISDIERLAKAGVAMTIGDAPGQVSPYPDPVTHHPNSTEQEQEMTERSYLLQTRLTKAIWYRWLRSKNAMSPEYEPPRVQKHPFVMMATQHGDKVWVSIHPTNYTYEPFQLTDDSVIFPSDALMAKIALWESEHP